MEYFINLKPYLQWIKILQVNYSLELTKTMLSKFLQLNLDDSIIPIKSNDDLIE